MALIDDLDLVTAARKLAYDAHRDQRYGDKSYTTQLPAGANVLFEFSCWTPDLLAAALLSETDNNHAPLKMPGSETGNEN